MALRILVRIPSSSISGSPRSSVDLLEERGVYAVQTPLFAVCPEPLVGDEALILQSGARTEDRRASEA